MLAIRGLMSTERLELVSALLALISQLYLLTPILFFLLMMFFFKKSFYRDIHIHVSVYILGIIMVHNGASKKPSPIEKAYRRFYQCVDVSQPTFLLTFRKQSADLSSQVCKLFYGHMCATRVHKKSARDMLTVTLCKHFTPGLSSKEALLYTLHSRDKNDTVLYCAVNASCGSFSPLRARWMLLFTFGTADGAPRGKNRADGRSVAV